MVSDMLKELTQVFERHGFDVTSIDIVKPAIEWYTSYRKYVDVVEHCTDITFHLIERKENET